jgi:hypothetical protein
MLLLRRTLDSGTSHASIRAALPKCLNGWLTGALVSVSVSSGYGRRCDEQRHREVSYGDCTVFGTIAKLRPIANGQSACIVLRRYC